MNDKDSPGKFLNLYDKYFQEIYDFSYYACLSHDSAEKTTSQIFVKALQKAQSLDCVDISRVWFYKTAYDLVKSHRQTECEAEENHIISGLRNLNSNERLVLILRYIGKVSIKDIILISGEDEESIKQLLYKGLTSLRERMDQA